MASMIHNALRANPRNGSAAKADPHCRARATSDAICNQRNPGTEEIYRKASSFSISAPRCLWPKGRKEEDAATAKKGEDPMSTSAYTRILVVTLAALALAACPGKKGKKPDETPAVYYVSPTGSDTNPGTQGSQFKTITH